MFITKTKHNKIVEQLKAEMKYYQEKSELKDLLHKIVERTGIPKPENFGTVLMAGGGWGIPTISGYPKMIEDFITGEKMLEYEGCLCIKINKLGQVTTGRTKQGNDKGYGYKLIREK